MRPIDFQKLVQMLTSTYDWHVATASLGSNYWPEGGSNVWQSKGNFHLWHPLQEEPYTEWEARVDHLYNEGRFTIDKEKAKAVYDEYQQLLLDQVPMTYLVYPLRFLRCATSGATCSTTPSAAWTPTTSTCSTPNSGGRAAGGGDAKLASGSHSPGRRGAAAGVPRVPEALRLRPPPRKPRWRRRLPYGAARRRCCGRWRTAFGVAK